MKLSAYILIALIALTSLGCRGGSGTTKVVRPKYHHRWFDRKKDKKTKRTRVVKMKS